MKTPPASTFPAFLRALRSGEELTNAATWKNRQALVTALSALLLAGAEIARACGVAIPFADDQMAAVTGAAAVLIFNLWATFATSRRVGLPARQAGEDLQWPDLGRE